MILIQQKHLSFRNRLTGLRCILFKIQYSAAHNTLLLFRFYSYILSHFSLVFYYVINQFIGQY